MQVKAIKRARFALLCVLAVAVLAFGAGCQGQTGSDAQTAYRHVSGEEAEQIIDSGQATVVDVRTDVDYDLGHIPGAILIPHDQITSQAAQEKLPDKNAEIVVYCDFGGISKNAAEDLAAAGYTNVVEFDGLEVWDGELEEGGSQGQTLSGL